MDEVIYMDYAATTPVDPEVVEAMTACLSSRTLCGNPSAVMHEPGRRARALIEEARDSVAGLINALPRELVWTSGATESDNLAIIGAARFRRSRGCHLVTALTEHKAVVEACRALQAEGFRVTWLKPDPDGIIPPARVAEAITPETTLVSIMHVNNETGVVQDIGAIGALCRQQDVLFHVDAAQSIGHVPLDVRSQCIDLLSLSAHKACGPKGVGALFLDAGRIRRVEPLLHGGGHERGLRPGTPAVHQIVGMARAFAIVRRLMNEEVPRVAALRDRLWQRISTVPDLVLNGHPARRACHILNVSVPGVEGESLLYGMRGVAVSSGSACASDSDEPSYVLRSLGRSEALAHSSVRFSLGRYTTEQDVDRAAACFAETVRHLRTIAPDAPRKAG